MRRGLEVLLPGLLLGLAIAQAGCQSGRRPWAPPEEHRVKVVSDAAFVRTTGGDYVDGYFAEYESEFLKQRMFMALEIPRYVRGDRLLVSGRFNGDFILMPSGGSAQDRAPVFEVEKSRLYVPRAPDVPTLK